MCISIFSMHIFIACMLILYIYLTLRIYQKTVKVQHLHTKDTLTTAVIVNASFKLCYSPCYQHCKYKWLVQVSARVPSALDTLENGSQMSTIKDCPICKKKMLHCLSVKLELVSWEDKI